MKSTKQACVCDARTLSYQRTVGRILRRAFGRLRAIMVYGQSQVYWRRRVFARGEMGTILTWARKGCLKII